MDREQWESICTKCGKCCYEKIDLGGGIIRYTDEPCEHLDTSTHLCKVYFTRSKVQPDCISLTEDLVRQLYWLPEDCAYLSYIAQKDTLDAVRREQKKKSSIGKRLRRKK